MKDGLACCDVLTVAVDLDKTTFNCMVSSLELAQNRLLYIKCDPWDFKEPAGRQMSRGFPRKPS